MPHGSQHSRLLQMVTKATGAFRVNDWALNQIDPDGLRYLATISVRANWFVAAIALIELVYRPYLDFGVARYATYVLLVVVLIGFNGYIHYRILSNRRTTWRWLFALYALDVFLVSAMLALSDGFSHDFVHLFYYPALALMAVLFASFWLNIGGVPGDHGVRPRGPRGHADGLDGRGRRRRGCGRRRLRIPPEGD